MESTDRDRIKEYQLKNHGKIMAHEKIYSNKKYESNLNFRLICRTRSRIREALNTKSKSISTKKFLGVDNDTYRKWIQYQFTPEMKWSNIEIDHVKPISFFDVSKYEEIKKALNWKNTQPLLKDDHQQKKRIKFNFLEYQLQLLKLISF